MKPTLSRELALDALLRMLWRRKPTGRSLVHPDQRSQYGRDDWHRFCLSHDLEPRMSRRSNCLDNAVAESCSSSLKQERIRKRIYRTRNLAKSDVFDYIEAFTIKPAAIVTWVASAPMPLSGRQREAEICLLPQGQSTS